MQDLLLFFVLQLVTDILVVGVCALYVAVICAFGSSHCGANFSSRRTCSSTTA